VSRIFLLSPAHCGGERARFLFNDATTFELAVRVREREGVPLGEIFTFLSGLYFRGKLAYARAFARPPEGVPGVLIITANDGLRTPEHRVNLKTLRRYARGSIDEDNAGYRRPLLRDARLVGAAAGPGTEVVLLGSVASGKYVDVLLEIFGDRLRFPSTFVGRGDMSRGGLMLRSVDAGRELDYVPVAGAVRHGPRPPRLEPRRWTRAR